MSEEVVIKSKRGLNNLPINSNSVESFYVDSPEDYIGLNALNKVLLRRSCAIRNIKFEILCKNNSKAIWIAIGKNKIIRFTRSMPAQTTLEARRIAKNKQRAKSYLRRMGVQVPSGKIISNDDMDGALRWFSRLSPRKAVVKPNIGFCGRGVTSSITSSDELIQAIEKAGSDQLMLEQHIDGSEHRLLVIGGRLTAAIRWLPAFVIGDGVSTIERLVKIKNSSRSRNPYARKIPLSLEDGVLKYIGKIGLTKDSVIPKGYRVQLQENSKNGAGEEVENVTNEVHQDYISIAENCWHALPNMAYCGIDLITEDISKPASEQSYAVLEVNTNCDIAMHHFPTCGDAIDVAGAIIDYLFPYEPPPKLLSIKASISGKVQGVGFRKWLRKNSILYGVTGYCENMTDGSVNAVFEGSEFSVNKMLFLCGKGPERSSPSFVDFERLPITGYRNFTVK